MKWIVVEKENNVLYTCTARSKAREDVETILLQKGWRPLPVTLYGARDSVGKMAKIEMHMKAVKAWRDAFSVIRAGDTVALQFPVINHSLFLSYVFRWAKLKNIKLIAVIHDLDLLRYARSTEKKIPERIRIRMEELFSFRYFSKIVVHNERMKEFFLKKLHIPEERLRVLKIFDYLISPNVDLPQKISREKGIIIAGNLKKSKAGYVYSLPKDILFQLYGPFYEDEGKIEKNVKYHGSFTPDALIAELEGGFGLVWDGESDIGCSGIWGEYLRINNPHKVSLYLACGIPIVIWDQAAMAQFICDNCCGITVASLSEIPEKISKLSEIEYKSLRENAQRISKKVRAGEYLISALE